MKLAHIYEGIVQIESSRQEVMNLIDPFLKEWQRDLRHYGSNHVGNKIVRELNKVFDKYSIFFELEDRPDAMVDKHVASGSFYGATKDIIIHITLQALTTGPNSLKHNPMRWESLVTSCILHELIHRRQKLKIMNSKEGNGRAWFPKGPGLQDIGAKPFKTIPPSKSSIAAGASIIHTGNHNADIKLYLGNKHEAMAWAKDTAEEILLRGATNMNEFMNLMLGRKDGKDQNPKASASRRIRQYWFHFGMSEDPKDRELWKRYVRYVIAYGKDYLDHENANH